MYLFLKFYYLLAAVRGGSFLRRDKAPTATELAMLVESCSRNAWCCLALSLRSSADWPRLSLVDINCSGELCWRWFVVVLLLLAVVVVLVEVITDGMMSGDKIVGCIMWFVGELILLFVSEVVTELLPPLLPLLLILLLILLLLLVVIMLKGDVVEVMLIGGDVQGDDKTSGETAGDDTIVWKTGACDDSKGRPGGRIYGCKSVWNGWLGCIGDVLCCRWDIGGKKLLSCRAWKAWIFRKSAVDAAAAAATAAEVEVTTPGWWCCGGVIGMPVNSAKLGMMWSWWPWPMYEEGDSRPRAFSRLRHFARRFWNQTCKDT